MIEVSKAFKKAVYAPTRACKARVRLEILDTDAYKDSNVNISNEEEIFSKSKQLTNKVRVPSCKVATFEKDYFKLDGTFYLMPQVNNDLELGFWSKGLCGNDRVFNPAETLTFTFTKEHSSMGLTIVFDVLNNEYAEQFNIYFYNNKEVFKTLNVVDNKQSIYEYTGQLDNYKKIVIEVVKWCKPCRRCKVVEVDFGVIKMYEDNSLIRLNIVQEVDPISSKLPSDEVKFTVDNSNRQFNMLNPEGYYKYIQQGQEAFVDLGVEVDNNKYEYVQVGKFYLKSTQSDEGTLTTTFTTRDIFELLSNDEIENLKPIDVTLYDFTKLVLDKYGIVNYKLSNNLKLIKTKGLHKKMSYRNLIQLIAIAGMCVIYSNNKGEVEIKQLIDAKTVISTVETTSNESIGNKNDIMNNILQPDNKCLTLEKDFLKLDGTFNLPDKNSKKEKGWISSILSNEECYFKEPIIITINLLKEQTGNNLEITFDTLNNEYATEFIIKAYNASNTLLLNETIKDSIVPVYHYENNALIGAKKIEVTINKWCKSYRRAKVFEIGFNFPVDHISFDNMYKEPQINVSQTVKTVEIKYYPNTLENPVIYTYTDDNIKSGVIMKLDNSLINSESDAMNVAKWIMKENNIGVNTFKVDWRGNPALALTDKITVQNGYGLNNIINIIKQEFQYEGYLSGKFEGKGMV